MSMVGGDEDPLYFVILEQAPSHEGLTKHTKHVKRNQTFSPSEKGLDPNLFVVANDIFVVANVLSVVIVILEKYSGWRSCKDKCKELPQNIFEGTANKINHTEEREKSESKQKKPQHQFWGQQAQHKSCAVVIRVQELRLAWIDCYPATAGAIGQLGNWL
ncbi:hypothetical protein CPB85DRAFT_1260715 [Mucidula mucida]|nr:hypothetical protein CPB85DRAFT_1260715 [Mucidula mucida]